MPSKLLWSSYGVEPELSEVMRDPLVHLIMRRDGISQHEVWRAVGLARARLAQPVKQAPGIETAA